MCETTTAPEGLADAPFRSEDLEKPATLRQLNVMLDSYANLENKFNTLCNHLGLNVTRNYQKFVVQDLRRFDGVALNAALNEVKRAVVPAKKWYQFWK